MDALPVLVQSVPIEQVIERAQQQFAQLHGCSSTWTAAAPGRVNLIGEHTDYNGGFVFPMAIDRYTVAVANASTDNQFHVTSTAQPAGYQFQLNGKPSQRSKEWYRYIEGVLTGCRDAGFDFPALNIHIESTVPLGGGLSSSASLEVAIATLIESVVNQRFDPLDKIHLCQKAEHNYAGVPCGLMDQFSVTLSRPDHAMLLDCVGLTCEWVPLQDPKVAILIINSNVRHELQDGGYASRRAQCDQAVAHLSARSLREVSMARLLESQPEMDPLAFKRARHVISENERTQAMAPALRQQDYSAAGKLMYESHDSLRDDFQVSCPEIDLLVQLAAELGEAEGVYGSRMTGGGFGGCTVSLVQTQAVQNISRMISKRYTQRTGITPTCFVSRPAKGAFAV